MEQFIREKIKDKPLNKKETCKKSRHGSTLRSGICSGCKYCFCYISAGNQQTIKKKLQMGKNNNDVQTATQQSGIDDSSDAYSENGTQSTEPGTSSESSQQTYQPTLADYQAVQSQLYRVALRPRNL